MKPEKRETLEAYRDCIRKTVTYLEANLSVAPTLDELASVGGFSAFHFHRIFRAFVGESVASHVKRLRLERAATHLSHSKRTVLDIALDAGFESKSSFAKAFKKRFKMAPGVFRRSGNVQITPNRKIKLIMQTKTIEPQVIEEFEPVSVYYVRKQGPYKESAEQAFGALMPFLYGNGLVTGDMRCFGISADDPNITEADKLRYEAAATVEIEHAVEGEVQRKDIGGGRWARFLHKGSYETLVETYNAIFSGWLPESGEELRDAAPMEEYLNRDPRKTKPENLRTLIYVPVR
ncbi:MAG: AraC family transcriptional regulator [Verrucomicrobiota bacterium]